MQTRNITLALAALVTVGFAQDAKPPAKQKNWKDEAEQTLVTSIPKEPTPAGRLAKLEEWSKKYPTSDLADERRQEYLAVYEQLNRPKERLDTATDILSHDPNDFLALRAIIAVVFQELGQPNPPAADLDTGEKTCHYMLGNLDAIFAPDRKLAAMTADQWTQVKPQMQAFTQRILGLIWFTRKNNEQAEAELTKSLQLSPNDAQVSEFLGRAILAQNKTKPEKQPLALFHYARAAAFDGQGSLDAANRTRIRPFLTNAYKTYHGSDEGLDQLLALAKANALPPAGFAIEDAATIEARRIAAENAKRAANPMMTLWTDLKAGLTGDSADPFFKEHIDGVGLPKFKGTLVSTTPATRPKQLIVAVEKSGVGDCTLNLEEGQTLPGKMDPGGEIEFEGVGNAYKKDPYMLILTVDKAKITGWTGKNVPVTKKATPVKKAD
jgi:hypothetical protein